jgi:hypothetical protein
VPEGYQAVSNGNLRSEKEVGQGFKNNHEAVKSFFLPNEYRFDEKLIPANSFTYYWTSWPF